MSARPEKLFDFCIGVDGGGSGTRVRLRDAQGTLLGEGRAGPSGLSQGVAAAWQAIEQAIAQAWAAGGRAPAPPGSCALGLGLAGATVPGQAAELLSRLPDFALVALESDAYTALLAAHGGGPGILLVAGTGSAGEALHHDGRRVAAGGWGFPTGDEAGGAWLGLRAVQHAQAALDGRLQGGALAHAVLDRTGTTREALLAWCAQADKPTFAQLAPLVVEAAATDPCAHRLLQEAADYLLALAHALDPKLSLPVVIHGSVGEQLMDFLAPALRARCRPPVADAPEGAILLLRASAQVAA
jgi:glucosamine kinase